VRPASAPNPSVARPAETSPLGSMPSSSSPSPAPTPTPKPSATPTPTSP
jgi:hypothetical protein